jgi:hypothetical protein
MYDFSPQSQLFIFSFIPIAILLSSFQNAHDQRADKSWPFEMNNAKSTPFLSLPAGIFSAPVNLLQEQQISSFEDKD